jgi:hypothetical protein
MELRMIVIGCRYNSNDEQAALAIRKHTGKSLADSNKLIQEIKNGNTVSLPDDFVLREDLEDCNFIVR